MPGSRGSVRGPTGRTPESGTRFSAPPSSTSSPRACRSPPRLGLDGGDRARRRPHYFLRHRLGRLLGGDARLLRLGGRGFRCGAHEFSALEARPSERCRLRSWSRRLGHFLCRLAHRLLALAAAGAGFATLGTSTGGMGIGGNVTSSAGFGRSLGATPPTPPFNSGATRI